MKLRALVFDDDATIRSMLWNVLDRRGYEVFTFHDPEQCWLHFTDVCQCPRDSACTDVIVTDIDMPGVDGLSFLDALERKGCRCDHVAVMSGSWTDAELRHAARLRCKVLSKPFHISQIDIWLDAVESRIPAERDLVDWHANVAGTRP